MKIKKRTIVWFVAAVVMAAAAFVKPDAAYPAPSEAIYVKDAVILPENEGKLVAISGHPEVIEETDDPLVGVHFPSPFVTRTVQQFKWMSNNDEWKLEYVHDGRPGDEFKDETLLGRIKIGDFELDESLIKSFVLTGADVKEDDFTPQDVAHMNEEGHVIREDFKCYYSTGPLNYRTLDKTDYIFHPDWDGAYLVSWDMWVPKAEDAVTLVGIQQGSTLTYCQLAQPFAETQLMDEADFRQATRTSPLPNWLGLVLALVCAAMGVKSLMGGKEKRKEN